MAELRLRLRELREKRELSPEPQHLLFVYISANEIVEFSQMI